MQSFIITTIAGFSTMIGIIPIFLNIKNINKLLVSSLSFASGVMFSVSTFDLLIESLNLFNISFSIIISTLLFLLFFIIGLVISKIIDRTIDNNNSLYKVGIISMVAIILHNIPEGIITFIAYNINKKIGINLALAIAFHNIPEGISIAIPIYYSTKNKIKAINYTLVSSLSEPFGALLSYLFLKNIINDIILASLFSIVCGIMIYISVFELIKEARKYKEDKLVNLFFIIGMIFMFITIKV